MDKKAASKMGQKGGSRNTEAQLAARLRNIAGQSRPRTKASDRPHRIVKRVEADLDDLKFPYIRLRLNGADRSLVLWVDDPRYRTEQVGQALANELRKRLSLPTTYSLSLMAPSVAARIRS